MTACGVLFAYRQKIAEWLTYRRPGCCTTCNGTGASSSGIWGKCTDCYATGHCHRPTWLPCRHFKW